MAIYWNRLKARNYSKFDSKLNKIEGAITDGGYVSPAEIAEIAEILEPSQMAGVWGSPRGEKLFENLIQN